MKLGPPKLMLRFLPCPFLVRGLAAADPAELVAAFAADEGDHLAVRQEAQRRLVRVAGDVEVRDEVVLHAVAADEELQLPFGRAGFDLAGLRRLPWPRR